MASAVLIGIGLVTGGLGAAEPMSLKGDIPPDAPSEVRTQVDTLRSKSPWRRSRAARSLGEMGPRAAPAVPFLIELLDDREVAKSFEDAVRDLVSPLGGAGIGVWDEAKRALVGIGAPSVGPLIGALQDERSRIRKHAAMALGGIKDPRAVQPLIDSLRDRDAEVRMRTATALGEIGDGRAAEPLLAALKDEDTSVRQCAVTALGAIQDWRAIEPLIEELRRTPPDPWAAEALFEITGERLGEDPQKWRAWWDQKKATYEASPASDSP